MSDSESAAAAAAPAEAPVPAPCASIKADLDKVAEKGVEACKDLLEAFDACVKRATEGTS
uniref:Si:dkey-16p21.8 n=1 Tax=Hippocampus comes TaxID=109280 RepID=A0A3Q2Z7W5_HIPCM